MRIQSEVPALLPPVMAVHLAGTDWAIPVVAQRVKNLTAIHEDAGASPGLSQWVKDPVLPQASAPTVWVESLDGGVTRRGAGPQNVTGWPWDLGQPSRGGQTHFTHSLSSMCGVLTVCQAPIQMSRSWGCG